MQFQKCINKNAFPFKNERVSIYIPANSLKSAAPRQVRRSPLLIRFYFSAYNFHFPFQSTTSPGAFWLRFHLLGQSAFPDCQFRN